MSDAPDPPESPHRRFVGREDLIAAFDAAYDGLGPDARRVMHVHGVGGIGKSELLREWIRRLGRYHPRTVTARIDFTDREARIDTTALARARQALRAHVPFPTFDVAYAHWWSLAYPGVPLADAEIPLLDAGEFVADLIELAKEIPGVGLAAKLPRVIQKTGGTVVKWWKNRGEGELKVLAGLTDPGDVAAHLRAFWAADVRAWQAETGRRAVLFLDTLEALGEAERSGVRGVAPDAWVREWADYLDGVLVITAGRLDLTWAASHPEWAGRLASHHVGDLPNEDAEAFLVNAGVAESNVRATIVENGRGVPLYLDLAADTYARIAEGRPPRPQDFDANLPELLNRFLHYLDYAQRAATIKLAVPATFDRLRFRTLMKTFGTGYPATADGLAALRAFPFVETVEPGRYALHDLVRDAIEKEDAADPDRADERVEVHRHLFAEAEAVLAQVDYTAVTADGERALREAVEHQRVLVGIEAWVEWFWDVSEPFREAARWTVLRPLREQHLDVCEAEFGMRHPITLISAGNLASVLDSFGDLDGAEPLYRRAMEGCESVLGPEHPSTLAATGNLGYFLLGRGEFDGAEALYRRVLATRERIFGPLHRDTLTSVSNLGHLLHKRGDLDSAESLYHRALGGRERVLGSSHAETLISVSNIGYLLQERGDLDGAELWHRRALSARERELGLGHPDTLSSANHLANVLMKRGRLDEAEPLHRRALAGRERVLGSRHHDTLTSMSNLGRLLHERGDFSGASRLLRRAVADCESALGPTHPGTLAAVNNLAGLLRSRGELHDATSLFRRAWESSQKYFGEDHPTTQLYRRNLDTLAASPGDEA